MASDQKNFPFLIIYMEMPHQQFQSLRKPKLQLARQINIDPESLFDKVNSPIKTGMNIFKILPSVNDFKSDNGPRIDQHGEIVKHSLVGRVDWYNKLAHGGKRLQFDDSTLNKGNKLAGNRNYLMEADEKTVVRQAMDGRSVFKKIANGSERKSLIRHREQTRSKNQLLDEIEAIKTRLEINRDEENQYLRYRQFDDELSKLPAHAQQIFHQQERMFDNHQSNLSKWEEFVQKASSRLERSPEYSSLVRSESYRNRLETADTLEAMKSDFDRYGPKVWYMKLRKPDDPEKMGLYTRLDDRRVLIDQALSDKLIVNRDLPEGFHSTVLDSRRSVELIRKPQSFLNQLPHQTIFNKSKHSFSTHSSTQLPFQTFDSNKYLQVKYKDLKPSQAQIMTQISQPTDLDSLIVQGKSQLELEAEQVYHDRRGPQAAYRKYIDKEDGNYQIRIKAPQGEELIMQHFSANFKGKLPPRKAIRMPKLKRGSSGSDFTHASGGNVSDTD